ncbi:hypothetical protein GQX73_g3869 [Xylaria multiplex]|uniref:Protein kinase domain-containing protein n=1 Tax=Xylaria multiplex TaxID=323545 RepID=A0A7C8MUD5_9PEZI|nr:hypothetical protein GQX73_g3869 [Xylaria multiplex]
MLSNSGGNSQIPQTIENLDHYDNGAIRSASDSAEVKHGVLDWWLKLRDGDPEHPGRIHVLVPEEHFDIKGPNGTHLCLVFPVQGQSVSAATKRGELESRPLPLHLTKKVAHHVALGLSYSHSLRIVHGDLHPANILLGLPMCTGQSLRGVFKFGGAPRMVDVINVDGSAPDKRAPRYVVASVLGQEFNPDVFTGPVAVADWGSCFSARNPPQQIATLGPYIVPEFNSQAHINEAVDIWMLGCLMFEMLTGRDLFGMKNDPTLKVVNAMMELLGPPPRYLMEDWISYIEDEAMLKVPDRPARPLHDSIWETIRSSHSDSDLSNNDLELIISFIESMLVYEPSQRPKIHEIMRHPFMSCSVQETNPDALLDAQRLDKERSSGKVRGPLHGIPYIVKDNMATYDKMETTAGSWMLMGAKVPRDAFVVSKLREAGAILLGKAALTEWAHMRSSNLSEGYSARGGQVRSPYNFTVNPGGSSSGSAASVASNQCIFSLGTETDGSVIIPAERNALVGIKPTVGLTSRSGVIPETRHQDTVGVLGRTVKDAALALDGIYGIDPRDPMTSQQQGKTPKNGFAQFTAKKDALKNARFGIPWDSFWALNSPDQNLKLLEIVQFLSDEGATIVNGTELEGREVLVNPNGWDWDWRGKLGFPNESEYTVIKVDFYNDIKAYLSELNHTSIRSVEDIIYYNLDSLGSEGGLPGVNSGFLGGQERFHESAATKGIEDDIYNSALRFIQDRSRHGINNFQQAASVAAQAGYPLVTVPAGVNETRTGMPYGLMLMGSAWSEANLIKWASAIEDVIFTYKGERALPKWKDSGRRVLPIIDE